MLRERWRSGSGESSDGIPRGPGGKSAPTKTSYEPIRDFGSTMAADIVFIVNPASANGRMRRRWKTYERAFRRELGPGFAVRTTDRAGHAAHHTRAALGDGATTIVSVGRDGRRFRQDAPGPGHAGGPRSVHPGAATSDDRCGPL